MKKNKFSVLGIVLALGFVFVGCEPGTGDVPNTDPKTIKITGFNLQDAEMLFLFVNNEPSSNWPPVTGGWIAASESGFGSDITVELKRDFESWDWTESKPWTEFEPWTGSGQYYIWIQVGFPSPEKRSVYHYTMDGVTQVQVTEDNLWDPYTMDGINNAASIDIKDAATTLDFAKFVYRGKDPDAG
jgi:hypothetical protein